MSDNSWTRIEALFAAALERPTELRAPYVRAESPDEQTANEVLSLIDASSRRGRLDSLTDQLRRLSVPAESYGAALRSRLGEALAGRYRIERELGRGGTAIVFLAEDLKHHRKLALKLLAPGLAFGVGAPRFLQEIAFAAQLAHPHILPMHDSGEVDELLFYVMPYVEGESLRDRLRREHRLPLIDALTIAREVADAIGYAHSRNVVHRDIKPENILLLAGHAVIADFGIASAISAAGLELSDTGVILGTPAYMSPEQATHERSVDGRADVYALGCVLFEMLTGAAPFAGDSADEILAQKLTGPPPSARAREPRIPERVERSVNRALATDRADRFATAEQFAEAIDQALRTSWHTRAFLALSPPLTRLLVGVLLLGLLLAGGFAWRVSAARVTTTRIGSLVVLPFENLSGDPAREYFVDGMHEAINNELAQIGGLRVISRTSAMHYKATNKSVPQIARELNVGAVLEGSVFSVGDSVRIQVQLIQTSPEERHLWARTYDRHVREVLSLHRELARNVAEQVRVTLTPSEQRHLAATRVIRPEAYTAFLKGQYFAKRWQVGGCHDGERYFQQAIALDSAFAEAYAGLAHCYILPHLDASTQRENSGGIL